MKRDLPSNRSPAAPTVPLPLVIAQTTWPYRSDFDPLEIQAAKGWHCVTRSGNWDSEAISAKFRSHLVYSYSSDREPLEKAFRARSLLMVFETENKLYITMGEQGGPNNWQLRVWSDSLDRAEEAFSDLRGAFLRDQPEEEGIAEFEILTVKMGGPESRTVKFKPQIRTASELSLHYGAEFEGWHSGFIEQLTSRTTGITILQGVPGTGKTSYLRHLSYTLQKSHRFYYLPVSAYPMLSSPATVDFWCSENDLHQNVIKVVLIEDAEALLIARASDNHESLSNLLNIADGFLGDFLKLHVICTINTPVEKLDPAVTRPGRLIASRHFRKLTPAEAQQLAGIKGLKLEPQEEYSLAEVYNSAPLAPAEEASRIIGFAA